MIHFGETALGKKPMKIDVKVFMLGSKKSLSPSSEIRLLPCSGTHDSVRRKPVCNFEFASH